MATPSILGSPVDPVSLTQQWVGAAVLSAAGQGYGFMPDCLGNLCAFLYLAAERVAASPSLAPLADQAENLKRLVNYMIDEFEVSPTSPKLLYEWTFDSARTRLCPLFPFC